ncbi:uncharacterized protein PAC_18436 [Phialocephala subalpina]|uniref:Uncharacterized protein n=1 Tax=Phialocephala subalpina TaxID=576137 RepID=A0A1L7XU86_9HELO|nr:uncharacterized protein PAC_18436 [Phialocephala subalpina]
MAAILALVIPFLLLFQTSPVSAIPNVTAIRIGQGDCSAYPNSYFHAGDNADAFIFRPDQADNSSINGLHTRIDGQNLFVYESSTIDSTIFCCDRGGTILDGMGVQSLLLSTNLKDSELGYLSQGIKPETYAHEVDGVRLDGVFLGSANVTTWAFRRAGEDYYQVRLLVPGSANAKVGDLLDGEVKGFLKVLPP